MNRRREQLRDVTIGRLLERLEAKNDEIRVLTEERDIFLTAALKAEAKAEFPLDAGKG